VKTHEQIRHEAEVSRQPKIADLVSPRPFQLKGLNEQLFSLFDTLNDPPVSERRLSFAEATRDHNFTRLRTRRFYLDTPLEQWQSPPEEDEEGEDQQQQQLSMALAEEGVGGKVSVARLSDALTALEVAPQHPSSSPLEKEVHRDASTSFGARPPSSITRGETIRIEPFNDYDLMVEQEPADRSILLRPRSDSAQPIETGPTPETLELLEKIRAMLSDKDPITFCDLLGTEATRREAAKTFYVLLNLLKHAMIRVKQAKPYEVIFIRMASSNVG
jgi:hypothetical protein